MRLVPLLVQGLLVEEGAVLSWDWAAGMLFCGSGVQGCPSLARETHLQGCFRLRAQHKAGESGAATTVTAPGGVVFGTLLF